MIAVVSPAKTLDFENPSPLNKHSQAQLLEQSEKLAEALKKCSAADLQKLMGISPKLGKLNYDRFQAWEAPFTTKNAKAACYAFKGDVYTGLDAETLTEKQIAIAQKRLRIISGLYGLLRPLDLIQPYRLEMGTAFAPGKTKDLYAFWDGQITDAVNEALRKAKSKTLLNLASNEYFNAIHPGAVNAEIISPVFKDYKNGKYKVISFFAKRARGLMARHVIEHDLEDPKNLKKFKSAGYKYSAAESTDHAPVFLRKN